VKSEKSKGKNKVIKTKELILEKAMRLFLEKGYSATSTSQICAAVGINKQTLYYHIKSKSNLFGLLNTRALNRDLVPYLDQAVSIEDPYERLMFMIREFTKMICTRPELRVLIHETVSIKDPHFQQTRKIWKKHYLLLRNTISQIQVSRGMFHKLNPSLTAMLFLGAMTWTTYWFDFRRQDENVKVADTLVGMILDGRSNPMPKR
jgi:AcrR family transcriptional regulator